MHVWAYVCSVEIEAAVQFRIAPAEYPLSLLRYKSVKYLPLTQYISAMCLIDMAVVSTFVLKKSHELSAETYTFLVRELEAVTEDLACAPVPPFVLANVQVNRAAKHRIVLDCNIVRIASRNYVRVAEVLIRQFLLLVKPCVVGLLSTLEAYHLKQFGHTIRQAHPYCICCFSYCKFNTF